MIKLRPDRRNRRPQRFRHREERHRMRGTESGSILNKFQLNKKLKTPQVYF